MVLLVNRRSSRPSNSASSASSDKSANMALPRAVLCAGALFHARTHHERLRSVDLIDVDDLVVIEERQVCSLRCRFH